MARSARSTLGTYVGLVYWFKTRKHALCAGVSESLRLSRGFVLLCAARFEFDKSIVPVRYIKMARFYSLLFSMGKP